MPRIDDYETKLLDEISTLKHNLKLEFDRGYSSGYAQRYVDMQHAGLNKIMHKAEAYEKLFCNFGGHENYVLCPVCRLYKNRVPEGEGMTRDQFLTEMMGECWHEWGCSLKLESVACIKCGESFFDNTDFSTPEGFFRLWNYCKEQEWWGEFIYTYGRDLTLSLDNVKNKPRGQQISKLDNPFEYHLLNTIVHPDTFANAIAIFKGWEK
jgi:hypothetical protein